MKSRRLSQISLIALAAAPSACNPTTPLRVQLDIRDFVASEPVESPQRIEIVYDDPERGISLFVVRNGPPQDCYSGCFFDRALGLSAEGRVGWIDLPYGAGPWTLFDVHATDASLFDPAAIARMNERLVREDFLIFIELADFMSCDPAHRARPACSTLLRQAARLPCIVSRPNEGRRRYALIPRVAPQSDRPSSHGARAQSSPR